MYAITGSTLTAGGLAAVMLLTLVLRHPRGPRWLQTELAASLLAVVVTGILGAGLGCLALVPHEVISHGADLVEVAAMGGSLVALLIVWQALRPRRRADGAADAPANSEATVIELTPPVPPRTPRPRSGRPPRKAA